MAPNCSARFEVVAQRRSDHLGRRDALVLRSRHETLLGVEVEPDRFHRRLSRCQSRAFTPAPPIDQFVDVVAMLGLVSELLDEFVADRLARLRVSVDAWRVHRSRSLRAIGDIASISEVEPRHV